MSRQPKPFLSPEQYLEQERLAGYRSQYYQGETFAMAGASGDHTLLTVNLVRELSTQLRRGPCRVYTHDMRVQVSEAGLYTYPDLVVACGDRKFRDPREDTLLNPTLIIEVLSKSTEAFDRGRKFEDYQTLESLKEYVLVTQDRVKVERYQRQSGNQWLLTIFNSLDDTLDLSSINCRLKLSDVYEDVTFTSDEAAST